MVALLHVELYVQWNKDVPTAAGHQQPYTHDSPGMLVRHFALLGTEPAIPVSLWYLFCGFCISRQQQAMHCHQQLSAVMPPPMTACARLKAVAALLTIASTATVECCWAPLTAYQFSNPLACTTGAFIVICCIHCVVILPPSLI